MKQMNLDNTATPGAKQITSFILLARLYLILWVIIGVFFLTGCSDLFTGNMNNPADPEAAEYQGFDTVAHPDQLKPFTSDAAELYFLSFTVSQVEGADRYVLELATDSAFTNKVYTEADGSFTANILTPDAVLTAGTPYYWRGAAEKAGSRGDWTETRSFTMKGLTGLSPVDGTTTLETKPTLSWDTVEGAAYYEVQIADSAEGVEGASPVTITAPAHSYTWPTDLTGGDVLHWRVKAFDGNGTEGAWTEILQLTMQPYQIGDTGPAGGIIYYDKGSYSDGWRYLEAAPAETEWTNKEWGGYGTYVSGTGTATGTGKANTEAIVAAYGESEPWDGLSDYAAKLCYDLEYGGYTDWFLPSKDELNLMYQNLHSEGIGGFGSDYYWSSSEGNSLSAWDQSFVSGYQYYFNYKILNLRVRASRAF